MPQRLIKESILVVRDGKRVKPTIGKAFNLTADEIEQLEKIRPQSIEKLNKVEVDPASNADDGNGDGGGDDDGGAGNGNVDLAKLDRDQLAEIATDMELKFAKNIGRDKLLELVLAAREADDKL